MTPKNIPDYADLMTLQEFVEAVESYCFTNDDGHGYYIKGSMMHDLCVPSDILEGIIDNTATHVAWFNK